MFSWGNKKKLYTVDIPYYLDLGQKAYWGKYMGWYVNWENPDQTVSLQSGQNFAVLYYSVKFRNWDNKRKAVLQYMWMWRLICIFAVHIGCTMFPFLWPQLQMRRWSWDILWVYWNLLGRSISLRAMRYILFKKNNTSYQLSSEYCRSQVFWHLRRSDNLLDLKSILLTLYMYFIKSPFYYLLMCLTYYWMSGKQCRP